MLSNNARIFVHGWKVLVMFLFFFGGGSVLFGYTCRTADEVANASGFRWYVSDGCIIHFKNRWHIPWRSYHIPCPSQGWSQGPVDIGFWGDPKRIWKAGGCSKMINVRVKKVSRSQLLNQKLSMIRQVPAILPTKTWLGGLGMFSPKIQRSELEVCRVCPAGSFSPGLGAFSNKTCAQQLVSHQMEGSDS